MGTEILSQPFLSTRLRGSSLSKASTTQSMDLDFMLSSTTRVAEESVGPLKPQKALAFFNVSFKPPSRDDNAVTPFVGV